MDKAKEQLDSMIDASKQTIEKLEKELKDQYDEWGHIAINPVATPAGKQRLWIKLTDTRLNILEAKERLSQQINAATFLVLQEHGVAIHNLTSILLNANTKIEH